MGKQALRQVVILGSTGSIGINTLDVIDRHPDRFAVLGLSANRDVERMLAQCAKYQPRYVVMADAQASVQLKERLKAESISSVVVDSTDALEVLAAMPEADVVVGGIVGAAGLLSTLSAVKAGKTVLIANKEPLVMMGPEIMREAQAAGATILPLDSEHNAIFQCLPANSLDAGIQAMGIRKILLTGSGGPFRCTDQSAFASITPDQACAHPNWDMGRKISVDSATMMNKGLELIEGCALFAVPADKIEIIVHPQSMIHSMVEYVDGSILAQMGNPDMRIPIGHALGWPERIETGVASLDLIALGKLEFEAPDPDKFSSLRLAREAAEQAGTMPTILNAANEIAVECFLHKQIRFDEIPVLVEKTMQAVAVQAERSLETVLEADQQARQYASSHLH